MQAINPSRDGCCIQDCLPKAVVTLVPMIGPIVYSWSMFSAQAQINQAHSGREVIEILHNVQEYQYCMLAHIVILTALSIAGMAVGFFTPFLIPFCVFSLCMMGYLIYQIVQTSKTIDQIQNRSNC